MTLLGTLEDGIVHDTWRMCRCTTYTAAMCGHGPEAHTRQPDARYSSNTFTSAVLRSKRSCVNIRATVARNATVTLRRARTNTVVSVDKNVLPALWRDGGSLTCPALAVSLVTSCDNVVQSSPTTSAKLKPLLKCGTQLHCGAHADDAVESMFQSLTASDERAQKNGRTKKTHAFRVASLQVASLQLRRRPVVDSTKTKIRLPSIHHWNIDRRAMCRVTASCTKSPILHGGIWLFVAWVCGPPSREIPTPTIYAEFKGSALPPCLYHPRRLIQGLYLGRISSKAFRGFNKKKKTRGGT